MKNIIASAFWRLSRRRKVQHPANVPVVRRVSNQNKWLNNADEVFAYLEQPDRNS